MQNAPISFSFAGLPVGYCFTTPERFALDIANGLSGYLPGTFNKIINSDSEPAVADRIDSLWYKTTEGRIYRYDGGWISPNPVEASGDERRIFVGSESDIWSYDGGDGTDPSTTPPTSRTGAMWQRDTAFDFRFPLGAGTSPAPYSTTVSVLGTGGEEKHVLTQAELPLYNLDFTYGTGVGGSVFFKGSSASTTAVDNTSVSSAGGGQAHQNMPPFIGVYFIKRTGRQFYTA